MPENTGSPSQESPIPESSAPAKDNGFSIEEFSGSVGDTELEVSLHGKYPAVHREFRGRVGSFVIKLSDFEETAAKSRRTPDKERTLPQDPSQRKQVLTRIGGSFADFVLRTRADSVAQAEQQPADSDRLVQVARAMGALRLDMIPGNTSSFSVPDAIFNVGGTIWEASRSDEWLVTSELHGDPDAFRKLVSLPPEDRAIRATGLLMAADLTSNGDALSSLARQDLENSDVTTVDGNPADVAVKILRTSGAKPHGFKPA